MIFLGYKVSRMSIQEYWKTCPGFYREKCTAGLILSTQRHLRSYGQRFISLTKLMSYSFWLELRLEKEPCSWLNIVEERQDTRYSVKLKLSGVKMSISYQLDAVPLSTDPDSALREENELEVQPSSFQKIIRKPRGWIFKVWIKVTKM